MFSDCNFLGKDYENEVLCTKNSEFKYCLHFNVFLDQTYENKVLCTKRFRIQIMLTSQCIFESKFQVSF